MEAVRRNWKSGLHWLGYNILGMVGLWGAALLFLGLKDNPPLHELIDRGQFFLYSVGFITPALYMLQKERKITNFPYRSPLTFSCFTLVLFAVILFAGITSVSIFQDGSAIGNLTFLRKCGIGVLVVSVIIGFLVTIFAEEREAKDLAELGDHGRQRIDAEFESGGGGDQ